MLDFKAQALERGERMRGPTTWALVSNAVCARILRDLEGRDGPEPIELISKAKSTHLRDIMADKAGRSMASDRSGRRSAIEPGHDPIRHDLREFAKETLDFLERHRRAQDFDRLAIFATSQMLGVLRREMPPSLRHVVVREDAVNLIFLSPHELRARVRAVVVSRVSG